MIGRRIDLIKTDPAYHSRGSRVGENVLDEKPIRSVRLYVPDSNDPRENPLKCKRAYVPGMREKFCDGCINRAICRAYNNTRPN